MKLVFSSFITLAFLIACKPDGPPPPPPPPPPAPPAATAKADYGIPIKYTEWEIGAPEHIKTVVAFYTSWDTKDTAKMTSLFSDTVKIRIPDLRKEVVIEKDKVNQFLLQNRNAYRETSNSLLSVVSLHDRESNEDWVMVSTYTKWIEANGKRDSVLYSDNWRLKEGKIDFLMSFDKVPTKTFLENNDPKK